MFTEDTIMYYCGKEVEEIVDMLNMMLLDFHQWCKRNKLTVHTGKTDAILISNTPFVGPMKPFRFGNSFIQFATKTTCLGIEIDRKLNWKPQIDQVAKKFSTKFKFIEKMKRLPVKVLEDIYFKGIIPCVTYCIAVWGTCPTKSFNRLEVLHAKAAKIIDKLSSETHDLEALRISNWKPLSYIYKRRIAAIMYQVRNKTLPQQSAERFPLEDNSTNNHDLRYK